MNYKEHFKRLFDIAFSIMALCVCSVPIVAGILAVKFTSRGPVFFIQPRIGLHGHLFQIYKIRTMSVDYNRQTKQTSLNDADVFTVGRILRRFKIDEMPQIFNVLYGDMSIVGPRPCLEGTKENMPNWALQRFEVRPGLTGLAQINGNISLSWEERWKHDVLYVATINFLTDVKIILKTVIVVLKGEELFRRAI